MTTWLMLGALFLLACFSFVLLFGAPYLPIMRKEMEEALDMIDLQPGQTLLELGCGDGKVLVAAAQRGWRAVGYELNPLLVIICKWRTWRYRKSVAVKWGNFWTQDWPPTDGIFVFVLQRYMTKLDTKIAQLPTKPVRVVSYAFTFPGKKPVKKHGALCRYDYR